MPNISYTYVPDPGWTGRGFEISHAPVEPSRLRLTVEPKGKTPYEVPILSAEAVAWRKRLIIVLSACSKLMICLR